MMARRFLWGGLAVVLVACVNQVANPSEGMFLLCAAVVCGWRALEQ